LPFFNDTQTCSPDDFLDIHLDRSQVKRSGAGDDGQMLIPEIEMNKEAKQK
jgi:hypothetical protein